MSHKNDHFKLHLHPVHKPHHHKPKDEKKKHAPKNDAESKIKHILSDTFRQIIAFAVFFLIGLALLNLPAYSKIISFKISSFFNDGQTAQEELLDTKEVTVTKTVLKTSDTTALTHNEIPELKLAVAPADNRIIIPRINQNVPIVRVSSKSLIQRDWNALENEMQEALKGGVVHYPGTSLPGQSGNFAITGHSSYFPWDPGRFKDVFALLHEVVEGDKIVVYWNQKKYTYLVNDIKIVLPEDIAILKQTPQEQLTLITCSPVGTNLKRLIVTAVPIDDSGKVLR